MHDYAFSARFGATPQSLRCVLRDFGDQIAAALNTQVDEVLVAGHSRILRISILLTLSGDGRVPTGGRQNRVLVAKAGKPMVSPRPRGDWPRRISCVPCATRQAVTYYVTAPGDGCCFALCDPVAVSGVTPPGKQWLLIMSAFTRSSPASA
jgi:hypothetical protein